jgi:ketosteroid isomerase-like protein
MVVEELVRRVVGALNARDFEELAEVPLEPDFQFRSLISDSEGTYYVGLDGLRQWAADIDEVFDGFHVEVLEVRPAGPDLAVILIRVSGRSKASGAPFDERNAQVWTWRNGRLWRNEAYSDPAEAMRAAGLAG